MRLAALLLVLVAGCSYPHLVDDGKVDTEYLRRIERGTAAVCSIAVDGPIPHALLTEAQAREKLAKDTDRLDVAEATSRATVLRAFGFVKGKVDLVASTKALLSEQAAAFYDPREKTFFLIDRPGEGGFGIWLLSWSLARDVANELAASHELVHALQDRIHDIEKYDTADNDDAELARQAVVEGEAMLYSFRYMGLRDDAAVTREDLMEAKGEAFERSPRVLQESLVFPYWAGLRFARALHPYRIGITLATGEAPDAWSHPPRSTAQILDPWRYLEYRTSGVEPPELRFGDAQPRGWRLVRENVLGAFLSGVLVGGDVHGWLADRYRVYERDGELALAWALLFDGEEEASGFARAYRRFQRTKGVAGAVWVAGRSVAVAEAPDAETFEALRDSAWLAH